MADELMLEQSGCLYSSVLTELPARLHGRIGPDRQGRGRVAGRGTPPCCGEAMPDGADVDGLSDHVFVTFEGAFLLARALVDPQPDAPTAPHVA